MLSVLIVAVFAAFKSGALPSLPAKVVLGLTIPMVFGASFAAVGHTSRGGDGALRFSSRSAGDASTTEDEASTASEHERVGAWRTARLSALGVAEETSLLLAGCSSFSVHELERLLEAGCPLRTALRILWPA